MGVCVSLLWLFDRRLCEPTVIIWWVSVWAYCDYLIGVCVSLLWLFDRCLCEPTVIIWWASVWAHCDYLMGVCVSPLWLFDRRLCEPTVIIWWASVWENAARFLGWEILSHWTRSLRLIGFPDALFAAGETKGGKGRLLLQATISLVVVSLHIFGRAWFSRVSAVFAMLTAFKRNVYLGFQLFFFQKLTFLFRMRSFKIHFPQRLTSFSFYFLTKWKAILCKTRFWMVFFWSLL